MDSEVGPFYVCPVCGYPNLQDPPRIEGAGGSFEICPSCSFQFGVSDDDLGYSYKRWRESWIAQGMKWDKGSSKPPEGWDPKAQLGKVAER